MGWWSKGARGRHLVRAALVTLWLLFFTWALFYGPSLDQIQEWVETATLSGPLLYLGLYVVAVFALLPRPALNAVGGLLFGLVPGLVMATVGGVFSALVQFLFARHVAGEAVAERLPESVRGKLDALADHRGLLAIVQLRLVPVIPYQAVNYGFGLTRIRTWHFVLGTAVGGLPSAAALVLVGAGGGDHGRAAVLGALALAVFLALGWWLLSRRGGATGPGRAFSSETG